MPKKATTSKKSKKVNPEKIQVIKGNGKKFDSPILRKDGEVDGRTLKPRNYGSLLQIRIDEKLKSRIDKLARKKGIAASAFVRNVLNDATKKKS